MKEIEQLVIPENVRYTKDHEWARSECNVVKIGISDYAQDQLGDIVFVELPEIGTLLKKGDEFGTVESVKAVSELFMPISGKVLGVNSMLEDSPESVNEDPYGLGWMLAVKPDEPAEMDALMDRETYLDMLKG